MAAVNAAATGLFDAAAPLMRAAPLAVLAVVSAATGLAMLLVIGRTSNQAGMARAKRGILAALFEVRLFNDDLRAVLRALGRMLGQNARYLGYSLVPLAWAAVPLLLIIAQLQAFYGYGGLAVGAPALVTMTLRDSRAATLPFALDAPEGIRVETDAVVLAGAGEVVWRIVPTAPGEHVLRIRAGTTTLDKSVHVADGVARRSPLRAAGLGDLLLYPSEPPLPADGPAVRVAVPYPEPGLDILGVRLHWTIVYVALSMLAALALAGRVGVTL